MKSARDEIVQAIHKAGTIDKIVLSNVFQKELEKESDEIMPNKMFPFKREGTIYGTPYITNGIPYGFKLYNNGEEVK